MCRLEYYPTCHLIADISTKYRHKTLIEIMGLEYNATSQSDSIGGYNWVALVILSHIGCLCWLESSLINNSIKERPNHFRYCMQSTYVVYYLYIFVFVCF